MNETTITPMELAQKYRALRDRVKEIKDRHKAELKPFTDAMEQLEAVGLHMLTEAKMNSVATDAGTIYTSTTKSYSCADPSAFRDWCEANGQSDLLEARIAKSAMESYLAEGHDLPPGVKASAFTRLNVRK